MRRFALSALVVFALLTFAPAGACAQKQNTLYTASRQQLEAVKVVLAQQAAWNKGDLDAFLAFYKDAPDTVAMLGGPVRGLAAVRSAFRLNYPHADSLGTLEYASVEARELGKDFVLITGSYHLERNKKAGGPADGTFVEVLERGATGWLVVFSETT